MGSANLCECIKHANDTGNILVPNTSESVKNVKNEFSNNSILYKPQSVRSLSKEHKITSQDNPKIILIQSFYLSYRISKKFQLFLELIRNKFDENIPNHAQIISVPDSNDKNDQLKSYTNENVQKIEEQYPFISKSEDYIKYHYVFYRDAYLFKTSNIIYQGGWNYNCKKHGYGTMINNNDGSKYTGFWYNDKFHYYGQLIDSKGNMYIGNWLKGKANGKGKLIMPNGYFYEGEWVDDFQNGMGIEKYNDNSSYEGQYKNGFKNGKGKYTWKDGAVYEGDFSNGTISGFGKFVWGDNRVYEGEWKDGLMDGKGTFTWPGGSKYIGEYKGCKKNGYGVYYWNDNVFYEGNWMNNAQHGDGVYNYNGKIIKGVFRYGKMVKKINDGNDDGKLKTVEEGIKCDDDNKAMLIDVIKEEPENAHEMHESFQLEVENN